jgi:5'(3')-deoxyribonucleotidase
MIIGVDCDDVLSETMKELLKTPFFTEKKIRWEDITSYNLREIPQL